MFVAPPEPQASDAAQQQAQQLSHELMSPYCPGRTISTCPSPSARRLEDEIAADFARGMSREQVVAHLEQRFGEKLGARFDPVPYAAVLLAALAGGAAILLFARRWSSKARGAARLDSRRVATPDSKGTAAAGARESVREAVEPLDLGAAPANEDELRRLEAALARADGL